MKINSPVSIVEVGARRPARACVFSGDTIDAASNNPRGSFRTLDPRAEYVQTPWLVITEANGTTARTVGHGKKSFSRKTIGVAPAFRRKVAPTRADAPLAQASRRQQQRENVRGTIKVTLVNFTLAPSPCTPSVALSKNRRRTLVRDTIFSYIFFPTAPA